MTPLPPIHSEAPSESPSHPSVRRPAKGRRCRWTAVLGLVLLLLLLVGGAAVTRGQSRLFFPGLSRLLPQAATPVVVEAISHRLQARLEAAGVPARLSAGGESIRAVELLPAFYEERLYRPAWVGEEGPLPVLGELLGSLAEAAEHGLDPADYHTGAIGELLRRADSAAEEERYGIAADLDLLASDAFLVYGGHLVSGRVNPESLDAQWAAARREVDLAPVLRAAAVSGAPRRALEDLAPTDPRYRRLQDALARLRGAQEEDPWPLVPGEVPLRLGDRGAAVAALAERLRAGGDLGPVVERPDPEDFDPALEEAVKRFQKRHGLGADGVVGEKTLAALNVPREARMHQVELNLERWRWLPRDLGRRYLVVNIPAYSLELIEDSRVELAMRVVVGRSYRRTPVFTDTMRYLVLNPYWEIPPSLAVEDKLPEIRKDPGYLERLKIRVYRGWGAEEAEVDPATVDWSALGPGSFPYRLRQDPGPQNALGRIKFMFPNKFSVYLHDTPSRGDFERAQRSLSSGCIRVERAFDLALALLAGEPAWTAASLEAEIVKGREKTIRLPEPVPVHLLYWTVEVDPDGTVRFLTDLYGRDAALDAALHQAAPPP